jgi:superfamily II DNA or RNA helicase
MRAKRAKEQLLSGEKTCIAGSRQIFSEGISINRLSAVVLAEPMSFDGLLDQIIGRIRRNHPDKIHPEVFDINFADRASYAQNTKRLAFYLKEGWQVRGFEI